MRFITAAAVGRPSVTVLAIVILLFAGVFAYRSLRVELFPEIEFPLVTVSVRYPSAGPEAVLRDVTAPVERAITGIDGLETVESITNEGNSLVLATFVFGTDMAGAESDVNAAVNGVTFPAGVGEPAVGRLNPSEIPVIQFSVVSDRDVAEIQRVVQSRVLPAISDVDGILRVRTAGEIERRVAVTVDPDRLASNGLSLLQVSGLPEREQPVAAGRPDIRRRPGRDRQDDARLRFRPGDRRPRRRRVGVRSPPPARRRGREFRRGSSDQYLPHERPAQRERVGGEDPGGRTRSR